MGNNGQKGTADYYATFEASAVTFGEYLGHFGTFVVTTTKKIFHLAQSAASDIVIKEAPASDIEKLKVVICEAKNLCEVVSNFAKAVLDKSKAMLGQVRELCAAQIK